MTCAVVLGTRPEIIKLAGIVDELGDDAVVVHTGQQHRRGGMTGSFALFTRIALRRQLLALLLGSVLILGVSVLRVSGIARARWRFGYDPGYTLSHVFVGSAFSLLGFVGAMLTALWVLVRTERG